MAARCDICGKGVMFGNRVSHANNRTRRNWKPNLHKVTVTINGRKRRLKVCTKCLRKIQKM
ncbi:MAG: 50S ribosomal protein L28 [Candidatus Hydrothermota bacterium]|uniref:Large ribosomal subunit protein bL28 n=1 Tax=candidate division WOR-3 bacterium TaxID=2052148 RepID=A0A7C1BBL5_UNCW3|nr:MAG: 50S ribosomal protein L28 [Candidatus Hydrothermae bacterium]HDM90170.1 50S ribosomal protein L28 [candidate division WOR-3 bacterium]